MRNVDGMLYRVTVSCKTASLPCDM